MKRTRLGIGMAVGLLVLVAALSGCRAEIPPTTTEPNSQPTTTAATTEASQATTAPLATTEAPKPEGIILSDEHFVNATYLNPELQPDDLRSLEGFQEEVDPDLGMLVFRNDIVEYHFAEVWEQGSTTPSKALAVVSFFGSGYGRDEGFCGILIGDRFEETIARFRQDYDWKARGDGKFWGEGEYPRGGHYTINASGDELLMTLVPETVFPFAKIEFKNGRVTRVTVHYFPTL